MPRTRTQTFGPGSLEGVTLKTWTRRSESDGSKMIKGKIEGVYTVYCGEGWEHDVEIDIDVSGWTSEEHEDAQMVVDAHEGHNAFFFVAQEIDFFLYDWIDPCLLEDEL